MNKLLDDIKQLNELIYTQIEEIKKLKEKHNEDATRLIKSITKHENLIFPLAKKLLVDLKFKDGCEQFIKKYGDLTPSIKRKIYDECIDISNISLKLEESGVVCRNITKVIKTINYDDLDIKDRPTLKLICK